MPDYCQCPEPAVPVECADDEMWCDLGNDENDSDSEEDDQENEDSSLNLAQNIEISSTNLTQKNTEIPSVTQDKNRKHVNTLIFSTIYIYRLRISLYIYIWINR